MLTEGRGLHAPAPIWYGINRPTWKELHIETLKRAKRDDYANGKTQWKRGLSEPTKFPNIEYPLDANQSAIMKGFIGEYAVSRWAETYPDYALRKHGDGGRDVVVAGVPIQVKTRVFPPSLVRESEYDRLRSYRAFVFCEWDRHERVAILGWIHGQHLALLERKQAKAGHVNIIVPDDQLEPMNRLRAFLRARGRE